MILISDLDRTLIYSKKSFTKEYSGKIVCVEKNGDKELTYVTSDTLPLLKKLLLKVPLVPCTMRSYKQTMRVDFIREMDFNTCICSNGAEIYINGEKDIEWEEKITSFISNEKFLTTINLLNERFYNIDVTVRNILGYYIEIKCKDELSAYGICKIVKECIPDENINVFTITNKVFAIDKRINKANAIIYLKKKLDLNHIISAGDSISDVEMLLISDHSIAPKHKTFECSVDYITETSSILAGEEIINHLIKHCLSDYNSVWEHL